MPTYEYQCRACGHQLEAFQKMSDAPLTDCPKCKQPALNKLVSAAGFQLKGSGWYATDYGQKGSKEGPSDKQTRETKETKETSETSETKNKETKETKDNTSKDSKE